MGFTPIDEAREPVKDDGAIKAGRFTPLSEHADPAQAPKKTEESWYSPALRTVREIGQVYPVLEGAANLASQAIAMPVAGVAGMSAVAGKALGVTEADPAEVVHKVGDALTYHPRTESGKHFTETASLPLEALAKAGQYAGDKTLDTTGSPVLATVADTVVNAIPMALPAVGGRSRVGGHEAAPQPRHEPSVAAGRFIPLDGAEHAPAPVQSVPAVKLTPAEHVNQILSEGGRKADAIREAGMVRQVTQEPTAPAVSAEELGAPPAIAERAGDGLPPIVESGREDIPAAPVTEGTVLTEPAATEVYAAHAEPVTTKNAELNGAHDGETVGDAVADMASGRGETGRVYLSGGATHGVLGRSTDAGDPAREPGGVPGQSHSDAGEGRVVPEDLGGDARASDQRGDEIAQSIRTREAGEAQAGPVGKFTPIDAVGSEEAAAKPPGKIMGKDVTGFDDAMLARLSAMRLISPKARAVVLDEIARREASVGNQGGVMAMQAGTSALIKGAPLTERAALVSMREKTNATGVQHEVVPHPQAAGKFTAVPVRADAAHAVQNAWAPGKNYAPLIDQTDLAKWGSGKGSAELPTPIRRENIIARFAHSLGTTVYQGRVSGKRLGYFRPGVDEVRLKNANDIEVAAHEVAHLLDHRVPEIQRAYHADHELAQELKDVSYDKANVQEGFAEAVRLFLTQPETLEARAPKAHEWLNNFADNHPHGGALRKAQADMTAWFGQDALNRARSKIGTEPPLAEHMHRFWDKFRQSTVDDLHGIYAMERDLTGKIAPNGAYESARLSRASASIADGAVRFGYPVKRADGSFKYAGKGLEEILQPVSKNIEDTLLYFVGRSSNELMGQGREHLFTRGEIDAMLKLRTPERDRAFQEYQEWNKGILDFAEAQGVINPNTRKLWQRTQYMPFHRVAQPGGVKGKPGEWSGVQALTGGTTNLKDILGNMVGNAAQLIDTAVKNEARLKVSQLSQQAGGGKFMVKIAPEARPVKVGGDQVLDAMFKRYGIAVDGEAPAFFEFLSHGQAPAGANVVAALEGGKPIWHEVGDPVLLRSLKMIDRPLQSDVVHWLGLPKRIGQLTITATPDFWLANIARDTLMGSIMSRAGFKPILDSLDGMRMRMLNDPLYKDYIANGGGLSSIFLDERHLRTKLEKFYRNQGIDYRTVLDAPDKMLTFIETLGDSFEMSTRLGEYKRAISQGENPRHAAYLGREVSTDFAMKGDSKALGFMYDTVMFLRPALVSWDRLYRGLAHDENRGAIAAKAGTLALTSIALYLLNRNNPAYNDLPDWDRDANWHFFVGDQHFRYPKIWELGALSSGAERAAERMLDQEPGELGKDFVRIVGATFSLNLMPQLLAPLYEQSTNRNHFTGAPIETPGMEGMQPFLRAKPSTSETMKALGRATGDLPESLQVNPARAEALLRGYFNTYALYGLMLTDHTLFADSLPAMRTDEMPVVRRFYSDEPAKHNRYETEFYDMLEEAKRMRGTLKELDDLGRSDWADRKEQSPLAGEVMPLEHTQKQLSIIGRDMEAVTRSTETTPEEKRQQLDALMVERNQLLKDAVTESKAAQKVDTSK